MLGWMIIALVLSIPAHAQDGLKTIDNSGGGQIVYGPLAGQSSLQGAMATMLRNVHDHFGDRPAIDGFYQARGTNSVATFFTLTAKSPAGKRIRGMVIVSLAKPGQTADGAIMYDDADRFAKTWSAMMRQLNQVWHRDHPQPAQSSQPGGASAPPHAVQPLHQTVFPDGSGTVGLPDGWRITGSNHGSVWADGPNGESVALAVIRHMIDPNNQFMLGNGRRVPAGSAISPCCDLLRAWLASAQLPGGSAPSFHMISSSMMQPGQGGSGGVVIVGELDNHDGKGPLRTKLQLSKLGGAPGSGTWDMMVFRLSVPTRLADQEGPTLAAIGSSLRQDARAIRMEGDAETRAINERAESGRKAQSKIDEAHYQSNRDIDATRTEQAKRNQAFDNYLLDQTVVQYNETGEHGTTGYATANWLVTQFPNQFQYVPTKDFVKPTDY